MLKKNIFLFKKIQLYNLILIILFYFVFSAELGRGGMSVVYGGKNIKNEKKIKKKSKFIFYILILLLLFRC